MGQPWPEEEKENVFDRITGCPKPVIVAGKGYALEGGSELAMASHLRIASDTACLGQPGVSLGLIPGYGGASRLVALVGRGKALELLMTGGHPGRGSPPDRTGQPCGAISGPA